MIFGNGVIFKFSEFPDASTNSPCLYLLCAKRMASSRIEQLAGVKAAGITTPLLMLRVPMLSEVEDLVQVAEYSLNSDITVLRALNKAAGEAGKVHHVIIMADLGDLREGFWDKDEMVDVCAEVEEHMDNLDLAGIGVNVGCYGSVVANRKSCRNW